MRRPYLNPISTIIFFLAAFLIVVFLPPFLASSTLELHLGTTVGNSMLANAIIFLVGYLSMCRFERYPQNNPAAYILPIAAASYSGLFVFLLLLRVAYSVKIILIAATIFPILLFCQHFLSGSGRRQIFLLTPFGNAFSLKSNLNFRFLKLMRPKLPRTPIDGLVVDFNSRLLTSEWESFVSKAALDGVQVFSSTKMHEALSGRVDVTHLMENDSGSLSPSSLVAYVKDVIDRLAVLIMLPLIVPICVVTAILICYESEGGVFFRQERVGLRGKRIMILKFRSMSVQDEFEQKGAKDIEIDRITKVGSFIRKYRIDELPQLWNVLMGDLSLIGPRPETKEWTAKYSNEIPFYNYRNIVKPGISGWAQVMQGHVHGVNDTCLKLEYDFYYLKHYSLWLDLLIWFKTIKTIFTANGSR